jgi:hypothetical protein
MPPSVLAIGNRCEGNTLDDMTVLGFQTTGHQPAPPVFIGRDGILEHTTWVDRPGRIFIDPGNAFSLLRANGTDSLSPQIDDRGINSLLLKP